MKKEKRIAKKHIHDNFIDIKRRIDAGKPTTFAERNWYNMQLKSKSTP